MRKLVKNVLSGVLVSSFALTAVGFAPVEAKHTPMYQISQIIAFGDSGSDNGSAYEISKAILETPGHSEEAYLKPGEVYWQNRYSNGKTAVEVLAEMADKPLVNYATGGATTGYVNYSDWMDSLGATGVLGQIEKFEASLNEEEADEDALYFIFAGGNDYAKFMDYGLPGTVEEVADQAVRNIYTAIGKLADLGAEDFFIAGALDGTIAPFEISVGRTAYAKAFGDRMNETLPVALKKAKKEFGVSIRYFEPYKVMKDIAANPQRYGIEHLSTPAQPTYPEIKPIVSNPDQYLFFDEWHFTRVGHRIMGESMYSLLIK